MIIIVKIEAKYDLILLDIQFHHPLALLLLTRLIGLVIITITTLYHIHCHCMLSTYHNHEKIDEFGLSPLVLPLCYCFIILATIENS